MASPTHFMIVKEQIEVPVQQAIVCGRLVRISEVPVQCMEVGRIEDEEAVGAVFGLVLNETDLAASVQALL